MAVYTDNGTNTPDGSHKEFTYTFPTIKSDGTDVKVALNGQTQATNKYTVTTTSPTKIEFNANSVDSTLQAASGAPLSGVTVRVYRDTYVDAAEAVYAAGSSIRAVDLNNNQDQILYALQEEQQLQINSEDIANGAVNSTHIKDGTIVNADVNASAAIEFTKLENLDSAKILVGNGSNKATEVAVSGDVTLANTGAVTIATGAVEHAMLAADAVDGDNIGDDVINSEHIAAGAIDLEHMSANSVNSSNIVDDSIVNADIKSDAAIAQSKLSLDADLTNLSGCQSGASAALAALTQAEVEILDGATVTTAELNYVDNVTSAIQTQLDAKQTTNAKITELGTMAQDTANALADLSQAEVQILDGATVSTAELNKLVGYTGAAADLNELNGLDKQTTITDDDAKFPTSGAVVDYVSAQLEPFGGFEVIANRTSFPNTQPVSGVVISITDASGVVFDSTSTPDSTTGNCKTAGNTNVTIQAAPDALQGKTIGAGVGMLVSSTGSGQNYTFHRLLAKDDDVEQLSQDINDFKNRYRVASSEGALTGTDDEGDLYFDTGANKMYVYDGSSWGEVTSTGDFKYLVPCAFNTGTGNAAVFNGSISKYDLRENSTSGSLASVTNAAQLMVSVNGVVQKPNTGTSIGSNTGFCMADGHTIEFGANLPNGSEVFIIQSGSALSINTPGDDTVTAAKLNAGTETTGHFLQKSASGSGLAWADASGVVTINVTNSGTDHWVFSGDAFDGNVNDPEIYLLPNTTYKFVNNCSSGTNPFKIKKQAADASTSDAGSSDGVTNNGATGGNTVTWKTPNNVHGQTHDFYYINESETDMLGYFRFIGSNFGVHAQNIITDGASGDKRGFQVVNGVGPSPLEMAFFGISSGANPVPIIVGGSSGNDTLLMYSVGGLDIDKGVLTLSSYGSNDTTPGTIKLEGGGSNNTYGPTISGPATAQATSNYTITLPGVVPTANGQALTATTAGVCTWSDVSSTTASGCMYENDQTISAAYTLGANKGAHSVGPITIENTVTISNNARWVIS